MTHDAINKTPYQEGRFAALVGNVICWYPTASYEERMWGQGFKEELKDLDKMMVLLAESARPLHH